MYHLRKLSQGSVEHPRAPLGNNSRPTQDLRERTVRTNINFAQRTESDPQVSAFRRSLKYVTRTKRIAIVRYRGGPVRFIRHFPGNGDRIRPFCPANRTISLPVAVVCRLPTRFQSIRRTPNTTRCPRRNETAISVTDFIRIARATTKRHAFSRRKLRVNNDSGRSSR